VGLVAAGQPAAPTAPPAPPVYVGYFSVSTFNSQWTTSGITIAASLDSSSSPQKSMQGTNTITSNTYTNEKPSWIGLSAGVPITTYKDVTYQSSGGTLVPTSITKQDAYIFLDGYFPAVTPSLAGFRYIPQPFFGLPLSGKVLRHSMAGIGIGLHWIEPFGGVIFDTQNNQGSSNTGTTFRYVFGIKLSITAVGKVLLAAK
jgi:hypothetical protein